MSFIIENGVLTSVGLSQYRDGEIEIPEGVIEIAPRVFFYSVTLKKIKLPASLKTIGKNAFQDSGITEIDLPPNLEKIWDEAFSDCKYLSSITFPTSLKEIEKSAFKRSGLTEIDLPQNLEKIGSEAFAYCENLSSVIFPTSLKEIGKSSFSYSGLIDIGLPSNLEKIWDEAFSDCKYLSSITFPTSLKEIGKSAFSGSGLTEINFPSNLEKIGAEAFSDCENLSEVTFPQNLKEIGESAFYGSGLAGTLIVSGNIRTIHQKAFAACKNVTEVILMDGVEEIKPDAFNHMGELDVIILPESLKSGVVSAAFFYSVSDFMILPDTLNYEMLEEGIYSRFYTLLKDGKLHNVLRNNDYLENNYKSSFRYISSNLYTKFMEATKADIDSNYPSESALEEMRITVQEICKDRIKVKELESEYPMFRFHPVNESVLEECLDKTLEDIVTPDFVSEIAKSAFSFCEVKNIKFNSGLQKIGREAFLCCSNLTNVDFPDGLKEIGREAFSSCRNLTNVNLPDGLRVIEEDAFNWSCLSAITIPRSVERISDNAFASYSRNLVIIGERGSYAEKYAMENGFTFRYYRENGQTVNYSQSQNYSNSQNTYNNKAYKQAYNQTSNNLGCLLGGILTFFEAMFSSKSPKSVRNRNSGRRR